MYEDTMTTWLTLKESLANLGNLKLDIWSQEIMWFVQKMNTFEKVKWRHNPEIPHILLSKIKDPANMQIMETEAYNAKKGKAAGNFSGDPGRLAEVALYGGVRASPCG